MVDVDGGGGNGSSRPARARFPKRPRTPPFLVTPFLQPTSPCVNDEEDGDPNQVRHRPPSVLEQPRELIVVCAPMRPHINLSRTVRVAGSSGVARLIACGPASIDRKIARDGADTVQVEIHRTLPPVLKDLREEGYQLVGLEQTDKSVSLHEFQFVRRTALIVGNERHGLQPEELRYCHHVVEIPIYGLPYAYNAASAATMALYEFCRQFPKG